jgi:hypothetical protein
MKPKFSTRLHDNLMSPSPYLMGQAEDHRIEQILAFLSVSPE